jgi:Ni/Fe-hydrogenase subunit HybB-like protein
MYLFGFIANRLNVAVTGMESASGTHYIPKWTEMAVTLSIIALGFAIFRIVAQYFPIFEAHEEEAQAPVEASSQREYVGVPDW